MKALAFLKILIIPLLITISCIKISIDTTDKEEHNYFRANIDGLTFVPCKHSIMAPPKLVSGYKLSTNDLSIVARNTCDSKGSVSLLLKNIDAEGVYSLDNINVAYVSYSGIGSRTDSLHRGYINITKFDTTNRDISATFEIVLMSTDSVIVTVTEGVVENVGFSIDYY